MQTEEPELITAMRENDIQHQELLWKYSELRERRETAEELVSDGSINVAVSRMQTETNHTRQRVWYILCCPTSSRQKRVLIWSRGEGKMSNTAGGSYGLR